VPGTTNAPAAGSPDPPRRTALITGASAGLGAEFARQLAARNYDLVLVARRHDRLEAVAAEVRDRHGVHTTLIAADLSERAAPVAIQRQLEAEGIAVDYLVNNAGAAGGTLLGPLDFADHARYMELMVVSVAHLCHLFVPPMLARGWGRVINVASVAGRIPRGGDCMYGPAKAYLVHLSEELQLTVAAAGVNVCALCPGFTHTEFHDVAGMQAMKQRTPRWIWYDADVVVREGLRAVERGRSVHVSGRLYRWLDPLFQSVWTRRLFRVRAEHYADR
jgi:uncharacterized protein